MDGQSAGPTLTEIPLIELGHAGPVALIDAEPDRFQAIFTAGLAHYGSRVLKLGDYFTRRWLARADTPYGAEIEAVAARIDIPGARMLNLSYEWSCTTAVGMPPSGQGNRLLRTLDWPLHGLGRNVVVARHESNAGPWFNVTWPGFVGAATAMAPGRFSAAINQPPMRRFTPSCWLDWAIERTRLQRRRFMPPMHLLRQVFETAKTYDEARDRLTHTPLAVPAFFSLSGTGTEDGCVIERTETEAHVRSGGEAAVANHWVAGTENGRMRGQDSPGRFAQMERLKSKVENGFDWVRPPILNSTTRLAVTANASLGRLQVRGYEKDGPVTRDFNL